MFIRAEDYSLDALSLVAHHGGCFDVIKWEVYLPYDAIFTIADLETSPPVTVYTFYDGSVLKNTGTLLHIQ